MHRSMSAQTLQHTTSVAGFHVPIAVLTYWLDLYTYAVLSQHVHNSACAAAVLDLGLHMRCA